MPKPGQVQTRDELTEHEICSASYVGSGEHKVTRWWGGLPQAWLDAGGVASRPGRQQTTICRLASEAERKQATEWVREALANGYFRYGDGDKTFPKDIWYRDATGQFWIGRCINSVSGEYKGWPVDEVEKREIFD